MADIKACAYIPSYDCRCVDPLYCEIIQSPPGTYPLRLTPSADVPACRDEDPAWAASLAACYDPPDYQRCVSCGAEIDHHLGCPDDPDPDYEAEAELRDGV